MARLSLFNSPLLLGFDHFERALDRVSKVSSDGYPPYNIEQVGENALRITLAVAGFAMSDLSLTIEDNQLVVRGKQTDDDEPGLSCIAASPRGSSSARLCSPKASRCVAPGSTTGSCISI